MPILSKLRTTAMAAVRSAQALVKASPQAKIQVRNMGGHRMQIRPSEYQKNRVIDDVIYFLGLGLIPIGLLVTYANVRIGPAVLVDTPEGYVPARHEYYKSPITRWYNMFYRRTSVEKFHERTLYYLWKANEKRKIKLLQRAVKKAQEEKKSVKGWYYVPMQDNLETRIKNAEGTHPVKGVKNWK